MIGIQELIEQTQTGLKAIETAIDSFGYYHPEDANITEGLKRSVARDVTESIHKIPLSEFLISSGTTGVAGAAYLAVAKVNDMLINSVKRYDIAPQISGYMVNGWTGSDLSVPIMLDQSLKGQYAAAGGQAMDETGAFVKATLTPQNIRIPINVDNSLTEDVNPNIIEWHIQQASKAMGYRSTEIALNALIGGSDGDGTLNSSLTGDADETKFSGGATSDIQKAIDANGVDEFVTNTMIITPQAWIHSAGSYSVSGWATMPGVDGFDLKWGLLDVLFNTQPCLHYSADTVAFTNCITLLFDRNNALLTGRKRWMQIENISDPANDLMNAVISCRMDSVTVYNDAIFKLTET